MIYFEDLKFRWDQLNNLVEYLETKADVQNWEHDLCESIKYWVSAAKTYPQKTSGSTGMPKLIQLAKSTMKKSALKTGKALNLKSGDNALLCLPARYIAGIMMIVRAQTLGMNLIIVPPKSKPDMTGDLPIGFCAMTPMQVWSLISTNQRALERVEKLIIGGGPVSSALESALQNISTQCYHTFGMTETASHIALRSLNGVNRSENFKTLQGVEVRENKDGSLLFQVDHLEERIITTRDIGDVIDNGRFIWKGRLDNMINSGGIKIIPEIIEKKIAHLIRHRYFVSGTPDPILGQKLILVIEAISWTESEKNDLMEAMSQSLDKLEVPKLIYFVPKFEETKSGKVIRKFNLLKDRKP